MKYQWRNRRRRGERENENHESKQRLFYHADGEYELARQSPVKLTSPTPNNPPCHLHTATRTRTRSLPLPLSIFRSPLPGPRRLYYIYSHSFFFSFFFFLSCHYTRQTYSPFSLSSPLAERKGERKREREREPHNQGKSSTLVLSRSQLQLQPRYASVGSQRSRIIIIVQSDRSQADWNTKCRRCPSVGPISARMNEHEIRLLFSEERPMSAKEPKERGDKKQKLQRSLAYICELRAYPRLLTFKIYKNILFNNLQNDQVYYSFKILSFRNKFQ